MIEMLHRRKDNVCTSGAPPLVLQQGQRRSHTINESREIAMERLQTFICFIFKNNIQSVLEIINISILNHLRKCAISKGG